MSNMSWTCKTTRKDVIMAVPAGSTIASSSLIYRPKGAAFQSHSLCQHLNRVKVSGTFWQIGIDKQIRRQKDRVRVIGTFRQIDFGKPITYHLAHIRSIQRKARVRVLGAFYQIGIGKQIRRQDDRVRVSGTFDKSVLVSSSHTFGPTSNLVYVYIYIYIYI